MAIKNKFVTQGNNSDYGHKNLLVNGDFQVWQRGTSFTDQSSAWLNYTADRWIGVRGGWATGITITKAGWTGGIDALRMQRTTGNTGTSVFMLVYAMETLDAKRLAGKTVTLQFKVAKGANFSAASSLATIQAYYGTGTDTGNSCTTAAFTNQASILNTSFTVNTTATQYSYTFTVPSNATQFGLQLNWVPAGTAGANDWMEVADFQLEFGSIATNFERRLYAAQLALCQRYFEVLSGIVLASGGQYRAFYFRAVKRAVPTIGNLITNGGTSGATFTAQSAWATQDCCFQSANNSANDSFTVWVSAEL